MGMHAADGLDPGLQLVPAGSAPRIVMFLLGVALPLAITAGALLWASQGDGPMNLVGGSFALTAALTLGGLAVFTLALWAVLDRAMRRQRVQLSPHRLEVKSSFYSQSLSLSELRLDEARVLDLEEHTGFKPALKTNGYSVAGFNSGYFRLRNGKSAFVATAGARHTLWLPTERGRGLLLQPRQPGLLLERLRELATAMPRR
ncbi:MAG: hypothetical protein EOP92_17505 [Lysobacteraceae bacterium]|nr:MAG: hypothetical protein EOP92_17505 [Xanthomonadaceae bacterium]